MDKPHIFFKDQKMSCTVCCTGPEQIIGGKSESFKVNAMRDLRNSGKYEEELLWYAECLVCKRQTASGKLPYLYY
ncbi:hypothetical protein I6M70_06985 [Acinetobacter pittii]|uniref:hypothetical protein n=1 Tax=Acinetobacter pittii TaxID=48296 RepID=UPI00190225F4|nr:hypothetical protein [Acinetobacter pittii]MBJ8479120.1 hypothetical protein [Acinetobacter pittii]MCU4339803.1 hypothetical protein [Acinetobacter pittii]MCU4558459.1 hypothetical protein [Acinetobacter pittii]